MNDCLKQFQFGIINQRTYSTASNTFVGWTTGTSNNWMVASGDSTDFTIQGFKNINLYGIKMQSYVQSPLGGNYGITEDFSWTLKLTGEKPSISGVFGTNSYNASLYPIDLRLSKYENTIMFAEPIKSLSKIEIFNFVAQGYGNNSLLNIKLDLEATFYFLYKFEGEEEQFAFL
jgi:hypothetical protein